MTFLLHLNTMNSTQLAYTTFFENDYNYFIFISINRIKVNIKIQIADIPRQYIMTKDNVGVHIDSVLYYHVIDPYVTTFLVENVHKALIERTQTTLRQIMGMRSLQDSIENRETIQHEIQGIIAAPAQSWGVKIESILIKDLQFSAELVETLSAAAKSKRLGESKIIQAQAEVESAKLMREASDILVRSCILSTIIFIYFYLPLCV